MCVFLYIGNVGIGNTQLRIASMHKIKFSKPNTEIIDYSCGSVHTVLLSKKNELITYGKNDEK